MSDPLPFEVATPRFALPLLFPGQAQKEFFVNEALLRTDLLLHGLIEGEASIPPAAPLPGQAWLVGGSPQGEFEGRAGQIAGWTEAGWRFVAPQDGLRVFDRSRGSFRLYLGGWRQPTVPVEPGGGETVDVEARAALSTLIGKIVEAGILSAS